MKDLKELTSRKPVDVLLINPGSLKAVYQDLANQFSAIETPSLAALFATYLRLKGAEVDLLDAPPFNLGAAEVAEVVTEHFDPKLVVVVVYGFQPSASTQNMPSAGAICREIKKRDSKIPILMTGTHPAALPGRTMKEEAVDFVCDREGPQTIYATLNALKKTPVKFTDVPSLWFREGDEIRSNPESPLMDDLDAEMPGAAWDLLPMDKYRAHNWHCFEHIHERQPYASIHTSLGCPFKCSFCCINAPFGKPSYRMWSPKTVRKELEVLNRNYGIKNIKFVDEMFVMNQSHVLGICDEIVDAGLDLNIWAYARVDTVKDHFLEKLNKGGFRWLALGIESGSKHVRDGVEKGRFGGEDILKVVDKIKAADINIIGNYIFGLPDDTHESMQDTLDLALEANCEFANFYSAMAYPGSRLYTMAQSQNWALPDDWIGFSQHSYETLPLRTEALTAAEVLKFRDDAFHTYFSHPRYLNYAGEKFGGDVLANIQEMTSIRLKRKIVDAA